MFPFPCLFRRVQHTVDFFVASNHFFLLRSLLSLFSSCCKRSLQAARIALMHVVIVTSCELARESLMVETSVTSIRPRRCTGLGLCIPCIHGMAHSDTSALNASGVKGIDVGATATTASCSGKTQLHGDLSFVFLLPADQKLWVFEDYEALKLLFRGRSRPFKVDF